MRQSVSLRWAMNEIENSFFILNIYGLYYCPFIYRTLSTLGKFLFSKLEDKPYKPYRPYIVRFRFKDFKNSSRWFKRLFL